MGLAPLCRVGGQRCRSLVGELGRERFRRDALEPILGDYDDVVIDTPPNLGLLTVNALVVAELVVAPVSAEDDASLHGIRELRQTLQPHENHASYKGAEPQAVAGITHSGHSSLARPRVLRGGGVP